MAEPEAVSAVVRRWEAADGRFAAMLRAGLPAGAALGRLGVRLCTQGYNAEALEVLQAAAGLMPEDRLLWTNLGVAQERNGLNAAAITSVERSLALSAEQAEVWLLLANMKSAQRDAPGAQAAYEAALALEPTLALAWQGLGLLQQEQRQFEPAIASLLACVRHGQVTAPVLSILGQLFYQTGEFVRSRDAYAAARAVDEQNPVFRRMCRETQFICDLLEDRPVGAALAAYQDAAAADPGAADKEPDQLLGVTFSLLSAYGHSAAARRVGEQRLALRPESAAAAYLLQALAGDAAVERPPEAYLVEYFDGFAERFDEHLVGTLGYDIPAKLCSALADYLPAGGRLEVLDIGCGTGLCGPLLRPFCGTLTGVDLAAKMLEQAARRQVYDRLVRQEITGFLTSTPASADVIVAADVLIYFGNLTALAAALARALRPGGLLAFSTERGAEAGHQLLSSGRFAHAPDYVRSALAAEFEECMSADTTVRLEAARQVAGNLFVFRRRAAAARVT